MQTSSPNKGSDQAFAVQFRMGHMQNLANLPHASPASTVLKELEVDPQLGITEAEFNRRLQLYGGNVLQSFHQRSAWKVFVDQFLSLIVALLAVAAAIAFFTGDLIEGFAILVALLLNAGVGFATEWQADRALQVLRQQTKMSARVRRAGLERLVDAEELVPGDLVILNAGDKVPTDGRLVEAKNLYVEESALTGESVPVEKSVAAVAGDAPLAERRSMLYLGTIITAGRGLIVVTATSDQTELGRIGKLVAEVPQEPTPLERKLQQIGRRLVYLVLAIAAIIFLTGWLRGEPLWVAVEVSISLAVAAVPEGLPAVTTLILALGVLRMARRNAIVRRLSAVETLGGTTVICTDKTGTLTENRLTVRQYFLPDGTVVNPDDFQLPPAHEDLRSKLLQVAVLCNEAAAAVQDDGELHTVGDPTETALLVAAQQIGIDVPTARTVNRKIAEIPFDAFTKRMITLHQDDEGNFFLGLKGAPAVVLAACSAYAKSASDTHLLSAEIRDEFTFANERMADQALRVLAFAEKRLPNGEALEARQSLLTRPGQEVFEGYTFLGFIGMIDPPRAEVPQALEQARQAGIRVVMLTGDQLNTARAIARELKLSGGAEPQALHARDLQDTDAKRLAELAREANVFARISPEDKLRIVEALKQAGEIVAVTGDGVNDAPALKRADIGVAMGERGTEVAKEAAAIVLTDDNFATIVMAIEGGRTIYANLIKFIHMMFSDNLGEVIMIFIAVAIGWPLPLLPLQILWMNLVTDVFPAFALAVEPATPEIMQYPPRSPQSALLSRRFLLLIAWQGAMLAAISLAAYWWALQSYGEGAHARTIALMTLIGAQLGHFFNCRSRTRSAIEGLFRNPFVWLAAAAVLALQLLAIFFTPLARVLDTTNLTLTDWIIAAGSILAPIIIVEMTKIFARQKSTFAQSSLIKLEE